MNPIATLYLGCTNPHAGVIATSPVIAPAQNPLSDIFVLRSNAISTKIHVIAEAHAARLEQTTALTDLELIASSDPPLKPSQPNHSMPVPK